MAVFTENALRRINSIKDGLIGFCMVRNEIIRIKAWLDHYRKAGITQFFVIDNGSDDGTYELLVRQPDVIVERITASFKASGSGIDWLNAFRATVGPDKWVLFADADEFLVYEGWPHSSIFEIVNKADVAGCNAIIAFLLDMYPDGPLYPWSDVRRDNLFAIAPCFDADYAFKFLPKFPWGRVISDTITIIGGPRLRLLSTMEKETSLTWLDLLMREQTARIAHWAPAALAALSLRHLPKWMPELKKTPIARGGAEFRYGNNHGGPGAKYYKQNVVLCHFKFLPDFYGRVKIAIARKQHYLNSAEYVIYNNLIEKHGYLDFRYAGTQRFMSPKQLVDLALIREMEWTRTDF